MNSRLQSPIVHWAGLAMRVLHVYLSNLGIVTHHIQRAMSQQRLEGEDISASTQIGDGKGVAKPVRMDVNNPTALAQTPHQDTQTVVVERSISLADEERRLQVVPFFSAGQVAPDGFSGNPPQVSDAPFAAFCTSTDPMPDIHFAGFHVHISNRQRTKLIRAQTGIQQSQDNGLVTVGAGPAHDKSLAVKRLGFTRIQAGFEQFFDVLLAKGLNDLLGKFRWGDFFGGIGQFEFFAQPGVEGAQGDVDISQRFSRQGIRIPILTPWFVLGAHPGQVIDQVGRFDFGDVLISDVVHPKVQIVFVGVYRAQT
jgi:hypothetical protein